MKEVIELLQLSIDARGELHLNAEQTSKLLRFMRITHVASIQRDQLVQNLKRMIKPEEYSGPESET